MGLLVTCPLQVDEREHPHARAVRGRACHEVQRPPLGCPSHGGSGTADDRALALLLPPTREGEAFLARRARSR